MITYLLLTALHDPFFASCPEVKVNVDSGLEWTLKDVEQLEMAKPGCERFFGEGACLVQFTKKAEATYHAVCRKPNS